MHFDNSTRSDDGLFDERRRDDASPGRTGELRWRFLDRVDDPAFDRVRRLLNRWYADYPPAHRAMLRGNLEGREAEQSDSAWFELYLHELHRKLGFDVIVEPPLPDVGGDPDFLVSKDDEPFVLEATIIGDTQDRGHFGRRAEVVKAIERIESPDFGLYFHIEAEGHYSPPMRRVRQDVEAWLSGLDWEVERRKMAAAPDESALETFRAESGEWRFSFDAIPRAPDRRGASDQTILIGPSDGGVFDHPTTLLDSLGRKAAQCRGATVPVVIAARLDGMAVDGHDVRVALMGPSIGQLNPNDGSVAPTGEHGAGLYRDARGRWRNRHIVGVLVWSTELRPWSVTRQSPVLWAHPDPSLRLPTNLPWDRIELSSNDLQAIDGIFDPSAVFDLPDGDQFVNAAEWPGTPFREARR
jgi:hypothetical protein